MDKEKATTEGSPDARGKKDDSPGKSAKRGSAEKNSSAPKDKEIAGGRGMTGSPKPEKKLVSATANISLTIFYIYREGKLTLLAHCLKTLLVLIFSGLTCRRKYVILSLSLLSRCSIRSVAIKTSCLS